MKCLPSGHDSVHAGKVGAEWHARQVKRVVMGLDRVQKTPCGFCFVEFYTQEETEAAIRYLNNLRLDDRQIR